MATKAEGVVTGGGGGVALHHRRGLRVVWVQIDGVGDVSINQFQGKTPLCAAFTPFLDTLARSGCTGLVDPVEPGLACGSDTAHLSMLGYDPRVYYRGRGAFESLGAGLNMKPGEIAFKSNFATIVDDTGVVTQRRADRNFEREGPILCEYLDKTELPSYPQHRIRVKYATEHRCGLVIEGPGLCDRITSTDPLRDNLKLLTAEASDESPEAIHTAKVVNETSDTIRKLLRNHPINQERLSRGKNPANCVLLRGCGERLDVECFRSRHGFDACMVAPTKVIAGIGSSLGIEILEAQGATGDYHTNLSPKVDAIVQGLVESECKLGFLHVKAVDDAGHDGDPVLKRDLISAVDVMVGQLIRKLWSKEKEGDHKFVLCCTADHSTPVEFIKDHSYEPVPLSIARVEDIVSVLGEENLQKVPTQPVKLPYKVTDEYKLQWTEQTEKASRMGDDVLTFDEVAASEGMLGRFPGSQVIPLIESILLQT